MNDTCCSSHFGRLAAVSTLLGDNEISEISVHRNHGFISVNYFNYSIIIKYEYDVVSEKNHIMRIACKQKLIRP